MTLEVTDFQTEVIGRSHEKPVLVDFWAPWCGPCRALGPLLEKLAEEASDRWTLAKVNTDENPTVAREYAIESIPAVKLFVDGRVVDEFVGSLPEPRVRDWLTQAIPDETRGRIAEARAALDEGDAARAETLLRAVLDGESLRAEARVLLARILVLKDPAAAGNLLDGIDCPPDLLPTREAVRLVLRLLALNGADYADQPGGAEYLEAIGLLGRQDIDGALARLIEVVCKNRRLDDDGARRACLALFTLLGDRSTTTRQYRRALESALF